jgi:hypothetical protein
MLENQKLSIDQFHCCLTYATYHLKNIQIIFLFNLFNQQHPFQIQPMVANDIDILQA